jgi:predicted metal-dependent hydrolase
LAVATRLGWIRQQQAGFKQQDRQSQREMVTGETHYVLGEPYRLNVIEGEGEGAESVRLRPNARLELRVRTATTRGHREDMLNEWYRRLLRGRVPELVTKWEPLLGVPVAGWGIRRMKTRWGSCNSQARHIWINLELAKKPQSCLEFIVVHEMVHLIERHHSDRFREHMDRLLPNWRIRRDELNRAPLTHEKWPCC